MKSIGGRVKFLTVIIFIILGWVLASTVIEWYDEIHDLLYPIPPTPEITYFSNSINIPTENEYIYINIPAYKLYYRGEIYDICVGRIKSKTPIGIGFVNKRRSRIVFSYSRGILKGQKIIYYTDNNGDKRKIPYYKMRALGIMIRGKRKFAIHSTTEEGGLRSMRSGGCIRISISDMLKLYPKVPVGTMVIIDYDLRDGKHKNIYNIDKMNPVVGFKYYEEKK